MISQFFPVALIDVILPLIFLVLHVTWELGADVRATDGRVDKRGLQPVRSRKRSSVERKTSVLTLFITYVGKKTTCLNLLVR